MMRCCPLQIRVFLPLLILGAAVSLVSLNYFVAVNAGLSRIIFDARALGLENLARSQIVFEAELRNGDTQTIQRFISTNSLNSQHAIAILVNPENRIVASSRFEMVDNDISKLGGTYLSWLQDVFAESSASSLSYFEDSEELYGFVRVCGFMDSLGSGCGFFFYVDNLSILIDRIEREHLQHFVSQLIVGIIISLVLSGLLHLLVVNKLMLIASTLGRYAAGDNHQRLSVTGSDEIAELSRYVDSVLDRIEEEKTKALNASNQLQQYFDRSADGLIVTDDKGQVIKANETAYWMFGYQPSELLGKDVSILMPDNHGRQHKHYIDHYLETRLSKIVGTGREVEALKHNKQKFPVFISITEIHDEGQRRFVATISDLTEIKQLEEKLRQSQKMEAVGQLVGGIAHDFNNLLGIIIGNLDLVRRKVDQDSRLEKQVNRAFSAAERGANLTRRLLNFSRQAPTEMSAMDVNGSLIELAELIQKALTDRVSIKLELAPDLPLAIADQYDFEDAITNLCINARDAMLESGVITIETQQIDIAPDQNYELKDLKPGSYIEVDVSDTGTGMSREVCSHIFEPFFSTKEKGKGTGLGLSMVYGFAKRCGGLITVYSEVGVGTTFKLFLPMAAEDTKVYDRKNNSDQITADYSGKERVLIVDDEVDITDLANTILSEHGYETVVSHRGTEALEIIKNDPTIDILFSDVIMPGSMDGYQLAQQALAINPKIKVCLSSGFTGVAMKNNGQTVDDFPLLRKPYSNNDLVKKIRTVLDEGR